MTRLMLTKAQMEKLTTVRLLKYYKSFREGTFGGSFWDYHNSTCLCSECVRDRELEAHKDLCRSVLNTREHVKRKTK